MKISTLFFSSILIACGALTILPANATQSWQDIKTNTQIVIDSNAQKICPETLAEWRKKNCSGKTCTARWNGQCRDERDTSIWATPRYYGLCGTHKLDRSSWKEQALSKRALTKEESKNACKYNNKTVTNGWQYDDVCRDKLDMNTGNLGHVTLIDSIGDADTKEIIKGLKGEASSKKLADGRYIFVLRKYANDPDRLGLVLRRYDRNFILRYGLVCKNDKYSYPDNIKKTVSADRSGHVRHTQLNGGWNPVYSAGELWIKNGQIIVVSNDSGHFKPSKTSLDALKETLDYLEIPTKNNRFYDAGNDKDALETYKNQCSGGKIQGWDECQ